MDKAKKYARRINVEEFNSCNECELARAYEAGYHEAEKDTIGRAIKWLEEHADSYNGSESAFDHMEEEMITDFRKAMEEEQ